MLFTGNNELVEQMHLSLEIFNADGLAQPEIVGVQPDEGIYHSMSV